MKRLLPIVFLFCCGGSFAQDYLFYLHNRFIEEFELTEEHPEYGRGEYKEIIAAFAQNGFTVLSEKRKKNTDIKAYAKKVVLQVDSLLQTGVPADHITVLGTSKGGYIAQYVSTYLKNPNVNFVFIGCYMADDVTEWPDIQVCGNILSIYDVSDAYGVPMLQRIETSKQQVTRFRELELTTGMKHGFLYKPLEDWVFPATQWGKRNYKWEDMNAQLHKRLRETMLSATVLIGKNDSTAFWESSWIVDKTTPETLESLYRIGSVSKQFTAVLVLQEVEKGHIDLHVPILRYLPELKQSWSDSVTVHQLLTHTHGIPESAYEQPATPLSFRPGTAYAYSQIGFDLLARIVEKTSGKSFADLSEALFQQCGMFSTFHPEKIGDRSVHVGHGERTFKQAPQMYAAAGGFASTANDLLKWNRCLHGGKLLRDSTYRTMITAQPNAVRQHPLFGETLYGYGITTVLKNGVLRLGQTGKVDGFCSLNFYYPETGASMIVLCNEERSPGNTERSFMVPMQLLEIFENSGLTRKLRYRITVDRQ